VIAGGATDGKTGAMNIVAPPECKKWLANPARTLREPKAASSMNSVECRSSEVEMTGKRRNATHTSKPALRMVTQRSWRCALACRTHWHRASAKIRPHRRLSASSTAQILTLARQESSAGNILAAKRILELANKAYSLYLTQNPTEQAKLLRLVLLNCSIDAVSVHPTYRKPFDLIFQRAKNEEWSGREDLNLRPPLVPKTTTEMLSH